MNKSILLVAIITLPIITSCSNSSTVEVSGNQESMDIISLPSNTNIAESGSVDTNTTLSGKLK